MAKNLSNIMVQKFGTKFHPIRKIFLRPNSKSFTKIGLCLFYEIVSSYTYPNPGFDPLGKFFSPNFFCLLIKQFIYSATYTPVFFHPVFFLFFFRIFELCLEHASSGTIVLISPSVFIHVMCVGFANLKFLRAHFKEPFVSFLLLLLLFFFCKQ